MKMIDNNDDTGAYSCRTDLLNIPVSTAKCSVPDCVGWLTEPYKIAEPGPTKVSCTCCSYNQLIAGPGTVFADPFTVPMDPAKPGHTLAELMVEARSAAILGWTTVIRHELAHSPDFDSWAAREANYTAGEFPSWLVDAVEATLAASSIPDFEPRPG